MLEQARELVAAGGLVILLLMALSLLSLTLIVVKTIQLWGVRRGAARRQAALAQWQAGDVENARAAVTPARTPADRVVLAAMDGLAAGFGRAELEADLTRRGNIELDAMTRHIRLLELIAMVGPLLGLLGTVLGMIESFQQLALAEGSANASLLAGGIWEALVTTAAGLVVAIPAAVAAGLLSARAEGAALDMESAGGAILLAGYGRGGAGRPDGSTGGQTAP